MRSIRLTIASRQAARYVSLARYKFIFGGGQIRRTFLITNRLSGMAGTRAGFIQRFCSGHIVLHFRNQEIYRVLCQVDGGPFARAAVAPRPQWAAED